LSPRAVVRRDGHAASERDLLALRPAIESYRPRRCAFVRSLVEFETEPAAPATPGIHEAATRR
jgi:hypothetical protein